MPQPLLHELFRFLRRTRISAEGTNISDGALLEQFVAERADAAFELLMQRHGPMVLAVCRRICGDAHAAEDAFQATFFVLAKRASAIRKQASIGSWLHGVAQRIACRAKAQLATRRDRERRAALMPERDRLDELTWQELRDVLDEEIGQLAEKHRAAIVLCYLEGKTHEQAAQELGWPKRTLTNRLARARELLRAQLVRRGLALSAGALTTALAEKASAAPVAAGMTIKGVKAATLAAAGKGVGDIISAHALKLAEEAMKGMIGIKTKLALLVATLCLVVGAGYAGYGAWVGQPAQEGKQAPVVQGKPAPGKLVMDLFGDPLPPEGIVRLGTRRFAGTYAAMCYSPDGRNLAVAGQGQRGVKGGVNDVRIWNAATGKELHHFVHGVNGVNVRALAYSPNGEILASGGADGSIWLWDVAAGKKLTSCVGHEDAVASLNFSADGKTLASGSADKTARLWDVGTGKERQKWKAYAAVTAVVFLPGGESLVSVCADGEAWLWDAATSKDHQQFKHSHAKETSGKGFSKKGTGGVTPRNSLLALSPDGRILAVAPRPGTGSGIQLWDTQSAKKGLHLDEPNPRFLGFSSDGMTLITLGTDVRLWDVDTGKERSKWKGSTRSIASAATLSSDAKMLAVSTNLQVQQWDVATGKELVPRQGHTSQITSISFAPGAKTVATASDNAVRLWDPATGKELRCLNFEHKVRIMRFLSDDTLLIAWASVRQGQGGGGGTTGKQKRKNQQKLEIRQATNGKLLHSFDLPSAYSSSKSAVSRDGTTFAFGENAQKAKVHLWNTATREKREWTSEKDQVNAIALAADGQMVAVVEQFLFFGRSSPQTLRLWDATGKPLHEHKVYSDLNTSIDFSPDGTKLVTASSYDKTVRIWSVKTGKELRTYKHEATVKSATFSADGKSLLVIPGGLFDAETGKLLCAIPDMEFATLAPNGKSIAVSEGLSVLIRSVP